MKVKCYTPNGRDILLGLDAFLQPNYYSAPDPRIDAEGAQAYMDSLNEAIGQLGALLVEKGVISFEDAYLALSPIHGELVEDE